MNLSELTARLDPTYQKKMHFLREKFQKDIVLADYKAQQQAQLEIEKQERARQVERERVQNSRELDADKHRNHLEVLSVELSQHLTKLGAEFQINVLGRLDAMEHEVFSLASRNADTRSQLRGDVFKQLAGAVIQEKLAQRQHSREMERLRLEHENFKESQLWKECCVYIFELLQSDRKKQVEEYIDSLVKGWEQEI